MAVGTDRYARLPTHLLIWVWVPAALLPTGTGVQTLTPVKVPTHTILMVGPDSRGRPVLLRGRLAAAGGQDRRRARGAALVDAARRIPYRRVARGVGAPHHGRGGAGGPRPRVAADSVGGV